MALPSEAGEDNEIKGLSHHLGKNGSIDLQCVSRTSPKRWLLARFGDATLL
jgi:hypothetical protein